MGNVSNAGFTLIELLVGIALTSLISLTVFNLFYAQNKAFVVHEQTVTLHQNLRAAMEMLQRDLRTTGFDPNVSGLFGLENILNRNGNVVDINGEGGMSISGDFNSNGTNNADETITYAIFDGSGEGIMDLGRDSGSGFEVLGEGVEHLAFAYAYADDGGSIVMNPNSPVGGAAEPLWAFDSDNDNVLDRALDTNGDGFITIDDDVNGSVLPNLSSGSNLIPLERIRATKIWMLGRARRLDSKYSVSNLKYKVGPRVVDHPDDGIRRQLLISVVKFRNLGL